MPRDEKNLVTKRKRVIVRLVHEKPTTPVRRPDFLSRLIKIYRGKHLKVGGAKLVARERNRY